MAAGPGEGSGNGDAVGPGVVTYGTPRARWVLAAAVLGSGIAFLDGTVVNVALPAIQRDLDASVAGLQWTLDAYLVTLSALLLLGGSLGDRYGRRMVFVTGLAAFTAASLLCGIAPTVGLLIAARALQGVGGAMLVPGSLAIISATFSADDRGRAVGAWSGLAGVTSAIGPFLGGWLIDAASWRLIFLLNVPLAFVAAWIALRHVPETRDATAQRPDVGGALLVSVGLAGVAFALIERHGSPATIAAVVGVAALVAFVVVERRSTHPMLPLELFRSLRFTGANVTTFAVYGGLGGALFLVVLRLQVSLGYAALEAGTSLLPFTVLMLLLSPRAGALAQRIGARVPMTVGPIVAGVGLLLFGRIQPGATYLTAVLPAVVTFGFGMTITVAPLTATVLASVDERHAGVASGVNNAVARLAGLLAVAVLPAVAGIDAATDRLGPSLDHGFVTAMRVCAACCFVGGAAAFALVRDERVPARLRVRVRPTLQADAFHPCHDPCVAAHEAR
jgi:EmrB/QacA subfamily drug resistance transporter